MLHFIKVIIVLFNTIKEGCIARKNTLHGVMEYFDFGVGFITHYSTAKINNNSKIVQGIGLKCISPGRKRADHVVYTFANILMFV